MEYIGEHLVPGNIGRLAIIISFTASLVSTASYVAYNIYKEKSWLKLARALYYVHTIAVLSTVGVLFYLMQNHYFEYDYVWKHTSLELEPKYLFAAFWEGQEGSFLLWMIWHALLGVVLLNTSKTWESKVMPVLATVQAFLSTMLMGVYIYGIKLGSSPFLLIRQLPENINAPWTQWPDYMDRLPAFFDGRGLNPLLQNYWMTIHPPTLFLGFAATLIPFCFAIAALISRKDKEWIKPALPWTLFGVTILGTGILMGGAWAYEALSFGGFWAWDPVENTSLVPWLVLVAALHLMVIQKVRGNVLTATYLFSVLSFLLVIYSSFLTRSGVLGETSVHAFVDLGLNGQLLIYLLFFTFLGLGLLIYRYKSIPKKSKQDDNMSGKEFWMFIGALILLISGIQITFSTSLPIVNDFFGPEGFIPFMDDNLSLQKPIEHYNSIQVPFAIIITLLMAVTQYLSYKSTPTNVFVKRITLTIATSIILAIVFSIGLDFNSGDPKFLIYIFLLFTGIYAVLANLDYWLRLMKGNKRVVGSSIAHIGFGLIIIGSLISNYKKDIISENSSFIHEEFPANENLLMEINDTLKLGDYNVSWTQERKEGHYRYYDINFKYPEKGEDFVLSPSILRSDKMDMNNPEPSTKHYLSKDIYTHITYADLQEKSAEEEWKDEVEIEIKKGGEILLYNEWLIRYDSLEYQTNFHIEDREVDKATLALHLTAKNMNGESHHAMPVYIMAGANVSFIDADLIEAGLKFRFMDINTEDDAMIVHVWKYAPDEKPFIIIQAIVFPYINVLWLGCIVMAIGSTIAMFQRIKDNKKE